MKTFKPILSILLLLALPLLAPAQTRKTYDLYADYGLMALHSKLKLQNLGSLAQMQAKFPKSYARCSGLGWTDAKWLSLTYFDGAWQDAVYQGQGGGQPITGFLASQNHVIVPFGEYWQTIPAEFSGGEYIGKGVAYVAEGQESVNTKLVLWHEYWNGDPADRNCLQSGTIAVAGNIGYVEGTTIRGFSLEGRQNAVPTQVFRSCGIRMSKPGEVTTTDEVYARNFRTYGIDVSGATPTHLGNISAFDNVIAGVGCEGCWGSTVSIDVISGDDNGALVSSTHSPAGGTGGGTWNIGLMKVETCVASDGRAWRGQVPGVFQGQFAVNVGAVNASAGGCDIDALFVVSGAQPNGNPQSSGLKVGMAKGFNYQTAVHDTKNLKRWSVPADYTAFGFEWSSRSSGLFSSITTINSAAACSVRVDFIRGAGSPSHTTCAPYRYILDGPPRAATVSYLDAQEEPDPPVAGSWSCGAYGAWSACGADSTRTRTRTCECLPAGSECVDAMPATSESEACFPPVVGPPAAGISPSNVLVVYNTAESGSQAMANAYATAWGIAGGNVIGVNLGTAEELASVSILNTARNAINAANKQWTVLAMSRPSRYTGGQSITSAITFGARSVSGLTQSVFYNYSGVTPRTDKGAAPSALLLSPNYIRRTAHRTDPTGQALMHLAKDSPSQGNLRGSARASQTATGVTKWDLRSTAIGGGVNACNWINQDCFLSQYRPGATAIIAAYQSMFYLGSPGAAAWAPGFYGDHVTSFGGYLPVINSDYQNSQGQTALTYHLDKGASFSVGSVSEPWQGSSGSLAQQFVDVSIFHPLFKGGKPVGTAAWAAVKNPDRMLFAGDPMCAPFNVP